MKALDRIIRSPHVDTLYRAITFGDLFIAASPALLRLRAKRYARKREAFRATLPAKDKIRVAFFLQSPSVWKCERLYRLLEASERYEPVVVVCPFNVHLHYDKAEMAHVMEESERFVRSRGYRYFSTYDAATATWRDVRRELNPDVIFYTKPYKDTLPAYHLYRFPEKLNCYIPYGLVVIDTYRRNYNLPFHNLLWKNLVETDYQRQFARRFATCGDGNVEVVGCLGTECMLLPDYVPADPWKPQTDAQGNPIRKKRIIWAPHHTVDYLFNFSNFLTYYDFMLELAERYADSVQFAFKPHPVLKFKLINLWGRERTDAYYQRWASLPNGQLEEGSYNDLFLTSDAMMHDCASFTAEYLYTGHPVMYLVKEGNEAKHWNALGDLCYAQHYKGRNTADIEQFVQSVIRGDDPLKASRDTFRADVLCPPDGLMPSEHILRILDEATTQTTAKS